VSCRLQFCLSNTVGGGATGAPLCGSPLEAARIALFDSFVGCRAALPFDVKVSIPFRHIARESLRRKANDSVAVVLERDVASESKPSAAVNRALREAISKVGARRRRKLVSAAESHSRSSEHSERM
jgi:hypothetical protein